MRRSSVLDIGILGMDVMQMLERCGGRVVRVVSGLTPCWAMEGQFLLPESLSSGLTIDLSLI
jgi:hypothetical protein